jgi:hypothetical protein
MSISSNSRPQILQAEILGLAYLYSKKEFSNNIPRSSSNPASTGKDSITLNKSAIQHMLFLLFSLSAN